MSTDPDIETTRDELRTRKNELFEKFTKVLKDADLDNVDLTTIGMSLRPGPRLVCPPGTQPTLEVFEGPDGSFEYRVVCK
ncbi:MAG TPA: hypothetical protein VJ751_12320 [Pyrinomonadaceae bacterium]|nr:hypothetical protein [Pyrinomonadaceae bacterium]